jgi:transcription elongation factor Elf1
MVMSILSKPYFHDEAAAYEFVESRLWPQGATCPKCGERERVSKMQGESTRIGTYKCYACRKPFTVKPLVVSEESKTLSEKDLKSLWNEAVAKGITQEVFTEKFGSFRSLKADSLDEVKDWIAAYEVPVERLPGEEG